MHSRFLFCLLFIGIILPAQNAPRLRSRGLLPAYITEPSHTLQVRREQEFANEGRLITPDERKLLISTYDYTQSIVQTGRLLVNDTISSYANRILDTLLKNDLSLRRQLNVNVYYSAGSNIVTLANGLIIIEMGLIARVETEGQLAYMLCHEIAHYKYEHLLKDYQYIKVSNSKKNFELTTYLDFSRNLENEADSLGLLLYRQSKYAREDAVSAFDILQHDQQAILQVPFYPALFEHGRYRFPSNLLLENITEPPADTNDAESTHPLTLKRQQNIKRLLADQAGGLHFIVSESSFRFLKNCVQRECCVLYLESQDFINAFYLSYCLLQRDSSDAGLKKIIGQALYNIAVVTLAPPPLAVPEKCIVQADRNGDFVVEDAPRTYDPVPYNKVSGESQRAFFFFETMDSRELAVLAFDWNWNLYNASGYTDASEGKLCDNLLSLLKGSFHIDGNKIKPSFFLQDTTSSDSIVVVQQPKRKEPDVSLRNKPHSRFDSPDTKIGSPTVIDSRLPKTISPGSLSTTFPSKPKALPEYVYYAFESYCNEASFINHYAAAASAPFPEDFPADILQTSNAERQSRYGMGIDSVYSADALYIRFTEIKRTETYKADYSTTWRWQMKMPDAMKAAAQTAPTKLVDLNPLDMDSADIERYVTFCMAQQWYSERINYQMDLLPVNFAHQALGDTLADRMHTNYIMGSFVWAKHKKRVRDLGNYIPLLIIPITTIPAVIYGLIPRNISQYQAVVFDTRTGKAALYYQSIYKNGGNTQAMQAFFTTVFRKTGSSPNKR